MQGGGVTAESSSVILGQIAETHSCADEQILAIADLVESFPQKQYSTGRTGNGPLSHKEVVIDSQAHHV